FDVGTPARPEQATSLEKTIETPHQRRTPSAFAIQRQADRPAGHGAAGDGLGEFHVAEPGGKVGEFDAALAANGRDKLRLHAPVRRFGEGYLDFAKFAVAPPCGPPS